MKKLRSDLRWFWRDWQENRLPRCPDCRGGGWHDYIEQDGFGPRHVMSECETCAGTGRIAWWRWLWRGVMTALYRLRHTWDRYEKAPHDVEYWV